MRIGAFEASYRLPSRCYPAPRAIHHRESLAVEPDGVQRTIGLQSTVEIRFLRTKMVLAASGRFSSTFSVSRVDHIPRKHDLLALRLLDVDCYELADHCRLNWRAECQGDRDGWRTSVPVAGLQEMIARQLFPSRTMSLSRGINGVAQGGSDVWAINPRLHLAYASGAPVCQVTPYVDVEAYFARIDLDAGDGDSWCGVCDAREVFKLRVCEGVFAGRSRCPEQTLDCELRSCHRPTRVNSTLPQLHVV